MKTNCSLLYIKTQDAEYIHDPHEAVKIARKAGTNNGFYHNFQEEESPHIVI